MFSKLACRSGFLPALRVATRARIVPLRACSSLEAVDQNEVDEQAQTEALQTLARMNEAAKERVAKWDETHAMYNSPERDYANYPMVSISDGTPRRLGIVPQSMLEPITAITGMSGIYLIGIGTFFFLLNKQVILTLGSFATNATAPLWLYIFWTYYWRKLVVDKPWWKEEQPEERNKDFQAQRDYDVSCAKKQIENSKIAIVQEAGKKMMYESYRENVDLQLEEEYRRRMKKMHEAVVNRLEYHSAVGRAKEKFETDYMIDYVLKSARASITPQQEKDMMAKCIADLKSIAARQAKMA